VATSPTLRLVKDELYGFAKSKVMLVLWVILPLIAIAGYLLLRGNEKIGMDPDAKMSASVFMSLILSSLSGTVAALMVAVDLVSERQRKVFELFIIRPIRREAIIWSKFIAVFLVVTMACILSMALGIAIDTIRGDAFTSAMAYDTLKGMAQLVSVIGLSAAVGVICGVLARSILVAVLLILYGGQNLTIVPMLPTYLGVLPDQFWVFQAISLILILVLTFLASLAFRRSQF
jgi:ABC-type transport system involved in multi-copper enzyme maturation permease subunit